MSARPHRRIGVLGAGQLALMLADAARPLGIDVVCAGQPGDCAERAAHVVPVDLTNARDVQAFAAMVDVVTIESENIAAEVLAGLNLAPNAAAIAIAQERFAEKQFLESCGTAVAPYARVDTLQDLRGAVETLGLPAILKTRRMGYDGKGQARLYRPEDIDAAWHTIEHAPAILERMLRFDAEVSMIAARGRDGAIVFYPLIENVHSDGILRVSTVPYADGTASLQSEAERCVRAVMERLHYVGVLAVEFFVSDGRLIANEMAPRVHNSGHWTIEGARTSQFENHLRAIAGMPLGDTTSVPTVMLNCIGSMPGEAETAATAGLSRHDYGKDPRPGRKLGHLTMSGDAAGAIAEWKARRMEADV